jgi:hypothetical protein
LLTRFFFVGVSFCSSFKWTKKFGMPYERSVLDAVNKFLDEKCGTLEGPFLYQYENAWVGTPPGKNTNVVSKKNPNATNTENQILQYYRNRFSQNDVNKPGLSNQLVTGESKDDASREDDSLLSYKQTDIEYSLEEGRYARRRGGSDSRFRQGLNNAYWSQTTFKNIRRDMIPWVPGPVAGRVRMRLEHHYYSDLRHFGDETPITGVPHRLKGRHHKEGPAVCSCTRGKRFRLAIYFNRNYEGAMSVVRAEAEGRNPVEAAIKTNPLQAANVALGAMGMEPKNMMQGALGSFM